LARRKFPVDRFRENPINVVLHRALPNLLRIKLCSLPITTVATSILIATIEVMPQTPANGPPLAV
jgi:hypothetical protein